MPREKKGPKVKVVKGHSWQVQVDPFWQKEAKKASQSFPRPRGGVPFLPKFGRAPSPNRRYQQRSDIAEEEIPTSDKVYLLTSEILNDKTSVPGHLYAGLLKTFHKRCSELSLDDLAKKSDSVRDSKNKEDGGQRRRRDDAHAIIKLVTASLLEARPKFAQTAALTSLTATAVETFIFKSIYTQVFDEIAASVTLRDVSLTEKLAQLEQRVQDNDSLDDNISKGALEEFRRMTTLYSSVDKVKCCASFLEHISDYHTKRAKSESGKGGALSADFLLRLVCQHIIVAKVEGLNAEFAFLEEFASDERFTRGIEGYALVTVQAAVHHLNESPDLEKELVDEEESEGHDEEPEVEDVEDEVNERGWFVYRGKRFKNNNVTHVYVHESVTAIPEKAFFQFTSLVAIYIPKSVTSIGKDAFHSCSALRDIRLPSSVKSIGAGAFCECHSLELVDFASISIVEIGENLFYGCKNIRELELPGSVVTIGRNAFNSCSLLTKIKIPNSVTSIGEGAFQNCSALRELHLPSLLTMISENLCSGCLSLTTIQLPNVVRIGRKAFMGCSRLEIIFLPSSLEQIEALVFSRCSALSTIHLPLSTVVNENSFEECDTLMSFCEPDESLHEWLKYRYDSLPLHRLFYSSTISVEAIQSCDVEGSVDAVDASNSNPLHLLAQSPLVTDQLIGTVLARSRNPTLLLHCEDKTGRTPIHHLCYNRRANLQGIKRMVDQVAWASLHVKDKRGKCPTALAIDCDQPMEVQHYLYKYRPVEHHELRLRFDFRLVENMVRDLKEKYVSDLSSKISIEVEFGSRGIQAGWVYLASQIHEFDLIEKLVELIWISKRKSVKALAYARDYEGRTAMDISVPAIKTALQAALLLSGRYDVEDRPRYEGKSSAVYFGKDVAADRMVALKFFFEKKLFEIEVGCRLTDFGDGAFLDSCVVPCIGIHDGDIDEAFQTSASDFDLPSPYCVVMDQGDKNLWEAVGSENLIADSLEVYAALHNVALALDDIHRKGFVHCEVCPKNIVRCAESGTWKLTDFDGAVEVGQGAGVKLSTAYSPPEMITIEKGRPVLLSRSNEDYRSLERYPTLQADFSLDVWSYGVLMYGLVTNKGHLLDGVDIQDNLNDKWLKKLARWDNDDTSELVRSLPRPTRNLLSKILHDDPEQRPSMAEIMKHEFFDPYRHYCELEEKRIAAEAAGKIDEAGKIVKRINEFIAGLESHAGRRTDSDKEGHSIPNPKKSRQEWNEETIVVCGYLEIQGSGLMNQTKNRFFVLRSYGVLEYYKEDGDVADLGKAGKPVHGLLEVVPIGSQSQRMSLVCETGRDNMTVRAPTQQDADRWIHACRKVLIAGDLANPERRPDKRPNLWCKI